MKYPTRILTLPLTFLAAIVVSAATATAPGFDNEQLRYSINWPSGLGLGEAGLHATRAKADADTPERLHFEFDLDAAVPGFAVSDRYRSDTSPEFCSAEFQKTATHGKKKIDEKTTFDQQAGSATRQSANGGGKTDISISQCSKDALAFLYYVRRELAQGRVPQPQTVYFGAPYDVRLEFTGTQTIRIGDKPVEADRVSATAKGNASEISFEAFFLKDKARTLALVRVPLSLGAFYMELVK